MKTMIMKKFQGDFSVPFPESSMFAFIVIERISEFSFGSSSIWSPATYFIFQKLQNFFSELQFK